MNNARPAPEQMKGRWGRRQSALRGSACKTLVPNCGGEPIVSPPRPTLRNEDIYFKEYRSTSCLSGQKSGCETLMCVGSFLSFSAYFVKVAFHLGDRLPPACSTLAFLRLAALNVVVSR